MNFQPHIEIICGPMYSGKTSELIRRVRRYGVANKKVLVVKYAKDVRYNQGESISNHDRVSIPARECMLLSDLSKDNNELDDVDVIGIDEGQFFSDIVDFADNAANNGKIVIISCLDGDSQRNPWEHIMQLIPRAEKVDKLSAICVKCFGEACYSHRSVKSDARELIGGSDIYMPLCRKCFQSNMNIN